MYLFYPPNGSGRIGLCLNCQQKIQFPGALSPGSDSGPIYLELYRDQGRSYDDATLLGSDLQPSPNLPSTHISPSSRVRSSSGRESAVSDRFAVQGGPSLTVSQLQQYCGQVLGHDPLTAFHAVSSFE
jgi:hypothetical protein